MAILYCVIIRPSTVDVRFYKLNAHSTVGRPADMKRLDEVIARQINACGDDEPV